MVIRNLLLILYASKKFFKIIICEILRNSLPASWKESGGIFLNSVELHRADGACKQLKCITKTLNIHDVRDTERYINNNVTTCTNWTYLFAENRYARVDMR